MTAAFDQHFEDSEFESDDAPLLSAESQESTYDATYRLPAVATLAAARVRIRSASVARINQFSAETKGNDDRRSYRALIALIADCVIDGDGRPVWSGAAREEISKMPVARFMQLQKLVLHHNGLGEQAVDLNGMIEDEAKN